MDDPRPDLPEALRGDLHEGPKAPRGFVAVPGRPGLWVRRSALPEVVARLLEERAAHEAVARELAEALPRLRSEHEEAVRRVLGAPEPAPEAGAHETLRDRLAILLAEREALLTDRRSSLRAVAWDVRARARWWRTARLGVLWQHAPRPVRVPRRYARTRPPSPAPTISIVTPSLNQGEFLEDTIRSVLEQGYPALEYVIRDGGSTDGTAAVLHRHRDRLHRVHSGPDGGQAAAINLGFAETSGEVMAYLNADDVLLPGALAAVARHFAEHPEVDAVYGHRILIDDRNRQVGVWITPAHDAEALRWADCVPQETLFWRRSAWERAGGEIDESFRYAMDWDLLLRLEETGARIERIPRLLGAFRVHEAQKTTSMRDVGEEESARLLRRCHGRDVAWDERRRRLRGYLARHVVLHTAHRAAARLPAPRFTPDWLRPR